MRPLFAALLLLATFFVGPSADAAAVKFGTVGDSLTDEYSFWGSSYGSASARNWVDQVATLRSTQVNFGTYAQWNPTVFPGGPRYTGYEYNYARLGSTSTKMLSDGQVSGVASQPASYVYVGIGTNDFAPVNDTYYGIPLGLVNNYDGIYNGGSATAIINTLVSNFTTALNQIAGPPGSPTEVKVIVGNVADWGDMPVTPTRGYTNPLQRALVTNAISQANAQIAAIAHSRGMPVVDAFGLLNLSLGPGPTVGGVTLNSGSPASSNASYFFLPDKVHPGTVWQGLLANSILSAANQAYGAGFSPLTDQEILGVAGLNDPNGGAVTSYYPVASFVQVPEPATGLLAMVGLMTFAAGQLARRRTVRKSAA